MNDTCAQPASLILLRHAKSSWAENGLSDHQRPLNGRGERDAAAVAGALAEFPAVDRVLCSSALRTRMTLDALVRAGAAGSATIEFDDALYLAEPDTMSERIRSAASARHLLLIAHNPGIEELASRLAGRPITMKTSALCRFERATPTDRWSLDQQLTPRG